jgi:ABC-2 type transport system ATP-binding protein
MEDFTAVGRTVLFATHYLDGADAVADRIVVLAEGRIMADGTGAEIKSRVAGRTTPDDRVDGIELVGQQVRNREDQEDQPGDVDKAVRSVVQRRRQPRTGHRPAPDSGRGRSDGHRERLAQLNPADR